MTQVALPIDSRGLQASTSPRLTPAGEGWASDRAVKRIAERGSLTPAKDLEPIATRS